jgi:AraC-like DNA-binding protein
MDRIAIVLYHIDVSKILSEEHGGGHQWENIAPDPLFSKVKFHVLCAYRMELRREWQRGFLRTHYDRLYYVESGSALLEFDDGEIELKPGHLYLIPANVRHRHSCPRRIVLYWCHFQAEAEGGIDLFELLRLPRRLKAANRTQVTVAFSELTEATRIEAGWGMLHRANLLLGLLMPFLRLADESSLHATRERYLPVMQFIEHHLADAITLGDLAGRMNLSTEHFCRSFSHDFHLSPMRYVMRKRIQAAQHLLCRTTARHHEIARQCGFSDPYHFSKAFKRIAGMAPGEYRKHYQ